MSLLVRLILSISILSLIVCCFFFCFGYSFCMLLSLLLAFSYFLESIYRVPILDSAQVHRFLRVSYTRIVGVSDCDLVFLCSYNDFNLAVCHHILVSRWVPGGTIMTTTGWFESIDSYTCSYMLHYCTNYALQIIKHSKNILVATNFLAIHNNLKS